MEKETLTSMPDNEDILAYAKKHYPIGTEYIHLDHNGVPHTRSISKVTRDPRFYGGRDCIEGGYGFIYCKDKWAKIIKEESNMATVYKVEVEIVSDWVNYTEGQMQQIVKEQIEEYRNSKIRVTEVVVVSRT